MTLNTAIAVVLSLFYYVLVLIGAEVLRVWLGLSSLMIRRLTIIGLAGSALFLPSLFAEWHWFIVAPGIFALIYLAVGVGLKSAKQRQGVFGIVYIFLALIFLFHFFWAKHQQVYAIAGLMVFALGDTLAALIGGYWGRLKYFVYDEVKSWQGTLGMFAGSWGALALVAMHMMGLSGQELISYVTLTAAFATLLEAVSIRGIDNFIIPVGTAFFLYYLIQTNIPVMQIGVFVTGIVGSFLVGLVAYWLRALDEGGVAGAILVGSFLYTFGGWNWVPPVLVFFITCSLLSYWSRRRNPLEREDRLETARGVNQVLANGGIGIVLAVLSFLNIADLYLLYLGFLGSLAGVTADTWATEIGQALGGRPRLITSRKEVLPGTSGGVTKAGLWGAVFGASMLALTGLILGLIGGLDWVLALLATAIVFLAGVSGALLDSLLGATLQVQYYCDYCLKYTEKSIHSCGCQTKPVKGLRWLNNDWVNLLASAWSALVAMGLYHLLLG